MSVSYNAVVLVFCIIFGAALPRAEADKECEPSELGYACMKILAPYKKVHWTVGGASRTTELLGGEVPLPEEGEIAFALEGTTTGYVGFGFTEVAGMMSPADIVLGWTNSEETVVKPYRAVTIDITDAELDDSVTLKNTFASEKDGTTIVAYTRSISDGTTKLSLEGKSEVIFAIAPQDELAWHLGDRDGGTILLGKALDDAPKSTPKAAPKGARKSAPKKAKKAAAKSATSVPSEETNGIVASKPVEKAGVDASSAKKVTDSDGQCVTSTLPGYDCEQIMPGEMVTLHWVIGPVGQADNGHPAPKDGEISIAMIGKTEGYVGFAFTEASGLMHPSITVVGWMTPDGDLHVKPYRVTSRTIFATDVDESITLTDIRGQEKDGYTTIEFTQERPDFLTSFEGALSINVAVADGDSLVRHSPAQRWSAELDLLSGSARDATKDLRKYYNWHGAIMAVSWMFLAQIGILVGSHKWVVPVGGKGGWFKAHRGVQTLTLLGTLAGIVIAILKFDEHEMTVARIHRLFGYLAFGLGWLQGVAGFLRPDKDHPKRYLFDMFHRWGGFLLGYMGPTTVLLGIYSYREIEGIDIGKWLIPSVVSLAAIGGAGLLLHLRRSKPSAPTKAPQPKPASNVAGNTDSQTS
ncbi:hypothetical protein BSKO_00356 [Bryopsis sp. KO-2023]|nr:hypothetical protein BSKO_00356 [Bryopsis sp. KO-2023]